MEVVIRGHPADQCCPSAPLAVPLPQFSLLAKNAPDLGINASTLAPFTHD